MKIGDMCLEAGQAVVRPIGSGPKIKPRTFLWANPTKTAMLIYMANRGSYDKTYSLLGMKNPFALCCTKLVKNAGVENVHTHRFRHTIVIEYLRSHHDSFSLMRLLGNSNMEMLNHYLNILNDDLAIFHGTASPVDNIKL
ncbi:MAG: tyrosine-type recombinase/integrase [Anaerolineaceae bacterium]|jgi:integrase